MGKIDDFVRARLRILRKTQQIRQADAARAAGWAQPTYSKYELGQHGTDMDSLDRLARFYGTTLAKILVDAPEEPADRTFAALRALYLKLPEDGRDEFVRTMQRLAGMVPPRTSSAPVRRTGPPQSRTAKKTSGPGRTSA